jgi:hypothetical protein
MVGPVRATPHLLGRSLVLPSRPGASYCSAGHAKLRRIATSRHPSTSPNSWKNRSRARTVATRDLIVLRHEEMMYSTTNRNGAIQYVSSSTLARRMVAAGRLVKSFLTLSSLYALLIFWLRKLAWFMQGCPRISLADTPRSDDKLSVCWSLQTFQDMQGERRTLVFCGSVKLRLST